jgi:hypothetical protein
MFYQSTGCGSGNILTLIINSIINALLHRMAFFKTHPEKTSFRFYVMAYYVGDDSLLRIKAEVIGTYNMKALQEYFASIGMEYTDPFKSEGEIPITLKLDDVDFLKRRFRKDDVLGIVGALSTDSLRKMVTGTVGSKKVLIETQIAGSLTSFVFESFLLGKDVFLEHQKEAIAFAAIKKVMLPEVVFESYDYFVQRYKAGDFSSWDFTYVKSN